MRKAATGHPPTSPDPVTIRVPFVMQRRARRRTIVTPGGEPATMEKPTGNSNTAFVHALAKAFRWRRLLETGVHSTVAEIAVTEQVNDSYVSRILRLTLLAPEIVEAVLDQGRPVPLGLEIVMRPFPVEWSKQRLKVRETL
jgi:hypothetical protein